MHLLKTEKGFTDHNSNEQTGFLPGRFIGENVRTALGTIEFTNKTNQPGLLLFADFEKAFDKIEYWKHYGFQFWHRLGQLDYSFI